MPLRDVQEAASHADPRTTTRYDRARHPLDRHATYMVATFLAGARRSQNLPALASESADAEAVLHLHRLYAIAPTPDSPIQTFVGKSGGGNYSDALAELDFRAGQVLDAIDQAGIADNTIVVWSSDNPAGRATSMGGSNGPWRGHFGSGFEGGMRAPAMARWPGKIAAGTVTDEMFSAVDWFPTLASLIGASQLVSSDRPIDGIDASAIHAGDKAPPPAGTTSSTSDRTAG